MPSILFVCTANQFRSPIAEASLLRYLDLKNKRASWNVESAGTWTTNGRPALQVTKQNGARLDLNGLDRHTSRQVTAELLDKYDLVVVMEGGHKEALNAEFKSVRGRVFMITEIVENFQADIPDPIVLGTPAEEVANEIHLLIQGGAEKILNLAIKLSALRKID